MLQLFGFVEGIENLLENSVRDAGLAIATGIRGHHRRAASNGSPSRSRSPLFRIVQEAVNNAVHHGRPSEIKVELSLVADTIRIAGDRQRHRPVGCGRQAGQRHQQHAHPRPAVSAAFSIEQKRHGGTTVVVDLPAGAAPLEHLSQAASA